MKVKVNFRLVTLCVILIAILVAPAWGAEDMTKKFMDMRVQIIKKLKLTPEKEKAIMALEDKYRAERKTLTDNMKKAKDELGKAVAAANPDEAKIKDLVSTLNDGQDKMFASFQKQRDEEMALMTPLEQGKYLMEMFRWRQQMMQKATKK